jgi:hypothetical protein
MADVAGLGRHADLFRRAGGLDAPPDVILSWPTPNYINPERHSDAGPIMVIVFLVLSIMVYLARMWARVVITRNVGLDDWIMTSAIIPLIGAAIAVILGECLIYSSHSVQLTFLQDVGHMGSNGIHGIKPRRL